MPDSDTREETRVSISGTDTVYEIHVSPGELRRFLIIINRARSPLVFFRERASLVHTYVPLVRARSSVVCSDAGVGSGSFRVA